MALAIEAIERCLEILGRELRRVDALSQAFEASISEFFRGPAPAGGGVADTLLAGRRHLEWFLVESNAAGAGTVLDRLGERFEDRLIELRAEEGDEVAEALEAAFRSVQRSHTGIFEVENVAQGAGAWLRDVTGFGSFALGDAGLAEHLSGGELLVGRLFPAGDGVHLASPAAALVDGGLVSEAIRRDLERIRNQSAAKVLRVSQGELEVMFFGAGGSTVSASVPSRSRDVQASSDDPVEDAITLLRDAGLDPDRARASVTRLAREPRDPSKLVHGASDVLGRILEELAFDTNVDLEGARRALIAAWELVSGGSESSAATSPREELRAAGGERPREDADAEARLAAIRSFEAGRASGGDPGQLIESLQRDLGIAPGDESGEADQPAPDFPGVVGAMIEEMRWELGATEAGVSPKTLEPLSHLAAFAKPIGVFEELRGRDLFQFATFWLQEKRALDSDEEAERLVEALRIFCEWSLDAQEVDVGSEFLDALDGLKSSLPRVRRANDAISAESRVAADDETEDAGELYEIVELDEQAAETFEDSGDRVLTASGDEITVILEDELREHLEPRDRVRATVQLSGHTRVHCCYPPESAALVSR